jgi:hypothetical protein
MRHDLPTAPLALFLRPNPPIHTDASKRRRGLLARVIGARYVPFAGTRLLWQN